MISRRILLAALPALAATAATAHHGPMPWDEEVTVVEGIVVREMEDIPHWEIKIRTPEGVEWLIDVGNDWRLGRAGLAEDGSDFRIGRDIRVEGYTPALYPGEKSLVAVRVIMDGVTYTLFREGEQP